MEDPKPGREPGGGGGGKWCRQVEPWSLVPFPCTPFTPQRSPQSKGPLMDPLLPLQYTHKPQETKTFMLEVWRSGDGAREPFHHADGNTEARVLGKQVIQHPSGPRRDPRPPEPPA